MIDKLDLRIPGTVPFSSGFGYLYRSTVSDPKRWRQAQHYRASASFDDCDLDVVLHMTCTKTKDNMHKLEILRTGDKSLTEMKTLVTRVFDVDPDTLGIMRMDLTADVHGVPVDWFKRHTLVRSKQTRREIGTVESFGTITKGRAETLYHGVKPNQIRIYDKTAERRAKYLMQEVRPHARITAQALAELEWYREREQQLGPDAPPLLRIPGSSALMAQCQALIDSEPVSFEAKYGHGMWDVITRVERQIAARDIEKVGITTVGNLWKADTLDPFSSVMLFDAQVFDPLIEDWGFRNWCCGMHLQQRVREFGRAETERWMKTQLEKNFNREKEKFAPFLRVTENVVGIDSVRLRKLYQASVGRQIALRAAA